jgi:hypothetical protein
MKFMLERSSLLCSRLNRIAYATVHITPIPLKVPILTAPIGVASQYESFACQDPLSNCIIMNSNMFTDRRLDRIQVYHIGTRRFRFVRVKIIIWPKVEFGQTDQKRLAPIIFCCRRKTAPCAILDRRQQQ